MSGSRIFLLPGFGEDHRCFRNMIWYLKDHDLVHVDYRPVLRKLPLWDISPTTFAKQLIKMYDISPDDRMLGHSMGGYFGYVLSTIQGNGVCMLGSFSDTRKIVRMTESKVVNFAAVGSGLIKTPLMKQYIKQRTQSKQFLDEMLYVQDNFASFRNDDMAKLLLLSYGEDLPPPLSPPLRIHAIDDNIVRPPDEPYHKVPGGHFSLLFHPDSVHGHMTQWLAD